MIHFKHMISGEVKAFSYADIVERFFLHAISKEDRILIVNLMLFMEMFARERNVAFHLIGERDWARLVHTALTHQQQPITG